MNMGYSRVLHLCVENDALVTNGLRYVKRKCKLTKIWPETGEDSSTAAFSTKSGAAAAPGSAASEETKAGADDSRTFLASGSRI